MNPTMIVTAVTAVLGLVGQILPLIGGSNSVQIGSIVKTIGDLMPLITDQIGATYTGIKNILQSISEHPATTADQLAALAEFDKQVDDAWNAIEAQIDPDK